MTERLSAEQDERKRPVPARAAGRGAVVCRMCSLAKTAIASGASISGDRTVSLLWSKPKQ
ncbi:MULTISPECIES: hypothetical protein [unclassified Streptomyces]|uniref:hypothetical protein n=1 Tax=unclassified Streptomyces TaxID=2593676 RepID=UPI0035D9F3C4